MIIFPKGLMTTGRKTNKIPDLIKPTVAIKTRFPVRSLIIDIGVVKITAVKNGKLAEESL